MVAGPLSRPCRSVGAAHRDGAGGRGAPVERCREVLEKCREANGALLFGEALVAKSLEAAERSLEAERLRALVRGGSGAAAAAPDPAGWQLEHAVDVERRCAAWRVSGHEHVRHAEDALTAAKVPFAHGVQELAALPEDVPGGHGVSTAEPRTPTK